MESPGTAPGSDPLITSAFMFIVLANTSDIGALDRSEKTSRELKNRMTIRYQGCRDPKGSRWNGIV